MHILLLTSCLIMTQERSKCRKLLPFIFIVKCLYNWSTINANNRVPKESHWPCQVMTVMSPSKKKSAVVTLSKWKMDCRFHKLSPLSCQLLSAVGTLVTNCHHILTQCRLSLKPLGRPLGKVLIWCLFVQCR